jgi:hypothetical protein
MQGSGFRAEEQSMDAHKRTLASNAELRSRKDPLQALTQVITLSIEHVVAIEDTDLKQLFWLELVNAGFWVQSRGTITLNLSAKTYISGMDAHKRTLASNAELRSRKDPLQALSSTLLRQGLWHTLAHSRITL